MRLSSTLRAASRPPLIQAVKASVATVGSWLLAGWLIPGPLPVFAAIAALLVVQPSVNQSFGKAIERSVGVIIGVLIASGLGLLLGNASWVVLIAIVVAIIVAWLARTTAGTANQVAISAMLVLALGASTPEYALDRILETLIGAAIGLIVNTLIVPPTLVSPATTAVTTLGTELADSLERLIPPLTSPRTPAQLSEMMLTARLLRPVREAADAALKAGEESLTFNPRRSRHRAELTRLRELEKRLTPMVNQVIGMTRAVHDHYDESLSEESTAAAIAEQLHRAAHDLRLLARVPRRAGEPGVAASDGGASSAHPATDAVPLLTAPLVVAPPQSAHWIVIGSLMEDLRRIREQLVG